MSPLILVCLAVVAVIIVVAAVVIFGFALASKRNPRAR
jgi:flagellar basal body-associated protein FliL